MRRLKILQIFSRYQHYGGEEGSVFRIGDALQDVHDVEYFFKSSTDLLQGSWLDKIDAPWKVLHNSETARGVRRLQDLGHFDLWQIHNVFPAMSPTVYEEAFRKGIPVIHYLHNYRLSCVNGFFLDHGKPCQLCIGGNFLHAARAKCWHESHLISGWMGAVLKRVRMLDVFHKVSRWVALSEAQKVVHVEMGIPAEKIDVIPHFYEPKGQPLPLPENGYALFLGRLSKEKGCMDLLEAWRQMPPERRLVIAGEGPELPALQKYVETEGLTNVRFAGFVSGQQQVELWRGAAFLAMPSVWMEPFGMVVLEAWSQGRPVVANAIGALPELITHGKTGSLVPPFHPEALAVEMERLFQNPEKLQAMSALARQEVETRFAKAEWLCRIQNTYQAALSPSSSPLATS